MRRESDDTSLFTNMSKRSVHWYCKEASSDYVLSQRATLGLDLSGKNSSLHARNRDKLRKALSSGQKAGWLWRSDKARLPQEGSVSCFAGACQLGLFCMGHKYVLPKPSLSQSLPNFQPCEKAKTTKKHLRLRKLLS